MNIIDIQDHLKSFSEDQLINEMQMPSGMAPQFLVLSEIQRRKRVRDDFAKRNAAMEQTVAQEAVAAAGVPMQGIAGMSEAMAPQSAASDGIGTIMPQSMRQAVPDTPAVPMQEGGLVGALFSKTDRGKNIKDIDYEIRKDKDGNDVVYKKGTNIYLGTAKKLFNKYDGGVIRAQNGLPLGIRQNNPGNIRPGAGFFGETGASGGYAEFESEEAGLRALARLLNTYGSEYDINTIRGLVGRYAPKSDNPDSYENYIKYMSDQLGIGADEEFDLVGRRAEVIPAIIGFEQGNEYASRYSPEMIGGAISSAEENDESVISKILSAINPISSAEASTLTPTSQQTSTPMPDIPQQIIRDETGRPIGDASYGPRIRAAMETGNVDIADQLVAQGVNEANFFEQMYKNRDPDDLGNIGQDAVTSGMGALTTPIGPGTLDPGQIAQVLPLDPTQNTVSGTTVEKGVTEAKPAEPTDASKKPDSNVKFEYPQVSGSSDLENEIKKLQSDMEKSREQDKWLAIAQAGLALMSSKEPTLLGAAGEAGISGLTAFREAQDRYQEGVVDLINARAKLVKDGQVKGMTPASAVSRLNAIMKALNPEDAAAQPLDPETRKRLEEEALYLRRDILNYPDIVA